MYVASLALREGEKMPGAGDLEMLRKYASEGWMKRYDSLHLFSALLQLNGSRC